MPTYSERPTAGEFPSRYAQYIDRVPQGDIADILESQITTTTALLATVPEERGTFRYQPGKWSINDVVNHVSDAERIFAYRALRIARSDATPLPGFEEDDYAAVAGADGRDLPELIDELVTVRRATLSLLRSFDPEVWGRRGVASGNDVSVRALAYVIAGHELHHVNVLRERYWV
jgi:uncharacterized damage-inducible protein DinB